ncbi:hypothetical protein A4R44_04460 [Amycolatopsis sp. M39]|nr:hypothetical protein A4R44_04460 [Amycolatopsis sp. M39]
MVATAALTIDVSKTSTLGFVVPGMRAECDIGASTASLPAVSGLAGGAVLFSFSAGESLSHDGKVLLADRGERGVGGGVEDLIDVLLHQLWREVLARNHG